MESFDPLGLGKSAMELATNGTRWERPSDRPFWDSLVERERDELRAIGNNVGHDPGSQLYFEGEPSTHVTILQAGWVKVLVAAGGAEKILALRGQGDIVGEIAAIYGLPRTATVRACEPVQALELSGTRFREFLARHRHAEDLVRQQILQRIGDSGVRLLAYGSASGQERLASLLAELAIRRGDRTPDGRQTIALPLTYDELASWADTSSDVVSGALAQWRRRNIIKARSGRIVLTDVNALERVSASTLTGSAGPPDLRAATPMICALFASDIAEFGDPGRDDESQARVLEQYFAILREALSASGIPPLMCQLEKRGDSAIVLVPPLISPVLLVDPLLGELRSRLHKHNKESSHSARITLRAALHLGTVTANQEGISGRSMTDVTRLLDAPVLKQALATARTELALMVSQSAYDAIVRPGYGRIDPDDYVEVEVKVKEYPGSGWMHVPGVPAASLPREARVVPQPAADVPNIPSVGTMFGGNVKIGGDFIMGNKYIERG